MQRKRMNLRCQFGRQDPVHGPVPVHPVLALERIGHDDHIEVAFRTGRHAVHVALINHFEVGRREFGHDFLLYRLLNRDHRGLAFPCRPPR